MADFYTARGNSYFVAVPAALRALGLSLPAHPAAAAAARADWAAAAAARLCGWPGAVPAGAKPHRSDGLLVGPFGAPPADLLIVNTDGTLAERSGNGLTIFAQWLADHGLLPRAGIVLRVHHDRGGVPNPTATPMAPSRFEGRSGFWLTLGRPAFAAGCGGRVPPLAALDGAWTRSVVLRIGNPHCVTFVGSPAALPAMPRLDGLSPWLMPLASGDGVLAGGVNLQWAAVEAPQVLAARVFERGEGPTLSSGTSATAVACAAWRLGLVEAGLVRVRMPGGVAPVELVVAGEALAEARLFGEAQASQAPDGHGSLTIP